MELVITFVVGVLLVEVYAWLPKISEWLVERAVSQLLVEEDQARCREEWKAGLDALPNSGARLVHALSFTFAAKSINGDSIEAKLEQIGYELEVLSDEPARILQEVPTVKMRLAQMQEMRKMLARVADESVASLRAKDVPASLEIGYENYVTEVERFDRIVVAAVNRAGDIADCWFNRLAARIEQIDIQIRTVRAALADARGLHRKRKLAELRVVLKTLDDDLQTLKGMDVDEVDDGEHAATKRELTTIITALQSAFASLGKSKWLSGD